MKPERKKNPNFVSILGKQVEENTKMVSVLAGTFSSMDLEETFTCCSGRFEGKVIQGRSSCGFEVNTLLILAVTYCAQLFLVVSVNLVNLQERSSFLLEGGKVSSQY